MYETLTPRENLTFAAAFILPKLSKESRQKEVDDQVWFCVDVAVFLLSGQKGVNAFCFTFVVEES